MITFLVPAIINVLLFRSRAYDHQFWWYYSVPAPAIAIAVLLDRVRRTSTAGRAIAYGVFALLLSAGARHTIDLRERHRIPKDDALVQTLNATLGPRDVFAAKDIESRLLFQADWWPLSFDPAIRTIDDAAEWWRTAEIDADRMFILVWDHEIERRPALREELARHGPVIRTPQASIVVLKRR